MSVIFKYAVNVAGFCRQVISTIDGPIIHVGLDPQGQPCVWVIGDAKSNALRSVMVVGTGYEFEQVGDGYKHIGSFTDGPFVWHIFDDAAAAGLTEQGADE